MKKISLTQGKFAIVDDADYQELSQYKWFFMKHRDGDGYAARRKNFRNILMHRQIMQPAKGLEVDHINRDKLDNRKSNLRNVSRSVNQTNRKLSRNNKTGHENIHWSERDKCYYVSVRIAGKLYQFGAHKTLEDALVTKEGALIVRKFHTGG